VSSPPPDETAADVASSCFYLTGSVQAVLHMQALWQRESCEKATVGSQGDRQQQGGDQEWLRYLVGGGATILPWAVRGDRFRGGTVHGVTESLWKSTGIVCSGEILVSISQFFRWPIN